MFRIGLGYASPLLPQPFFVLSSSSSSSISNASRRGPSFTFLLPSPTSQLHLLPPSHRRFHSSASASASASATRSSSSQRSRPSSFLSSSSSLSSFSSFSFPPGTRAQPSRSSTSVHPPQRRFISSEDHKPFVKGTKVDVFVRGSGPQIRFRPPKQSRGEAFNGSFKDMKESYLNLPWSVRPILILFFSNLSTFLIFYLINVLELAAEHSKVPLDQLNSHSSNQAWFDNMLVSWNGLKEGKVWTLFVSGICHDYGSKLFIDLIAMQLAGPPLLMAMGAYTPFIALLATSSVVGNLSAAAVMNFKGEPKTRIPGGQAPVAGIVTYLALISNSKQALSVGSLIFRPWALPFVLFGSMLFGDYLGDRDFLNGQTSAQWGGAAGGVLFFVVKKALRL